MRSHVGVLSVLVVAAGLAAATATEAQSYQGLRPATGLPGPKASGATAQPTTRADAGPVFNDRVLEMTPATLDRFVKALALEEAARKSIAAKAAAPPPKATKSKEEYQQCQVELMMTPEFQQLLQESTAALTGSSKDPAAAQNAARKVQEKMQAEVDKACGPDPGKTYSKPDVGSLLREAQADVAKANDFTVRQYAVIKERVTPLCLADPTPPSPEGLKIRGDGPVFFVYTAGEVEAVRPRCETFIKVLYPDKR